VITPWAGIMHLREVASLFSALRHGFSHSGVRAWENRRPLLSCWSHLKKVPFVGGCHGTAQPHRFIFRLYAAVGLRLGTGESVPEWAKKKKKKSFTAEVGSQRTAAEGARSKISRVCSRSPQTCRSNRCWTFLKFLCLFARTIHAHTQRDVDFHSLLSFGAPPWARGCIGTLRKKPRARTSGQLDRNR